MQPQHHHSAPRQSRGVTRRLRFITLTLVACLVAYGCGVGTQKILRSTTPGEHYRAGYEPQAAQQKVAGLLPHLTVVEHRVRILGYQRERFGNGWGTQVSPEGWYCQTRHLVLAQHFAHRTDNPTGGDSPSSASAGTPAAASSASHSCPTPTGTAPDQYTEQPVTAPEVDIDHIFPLAAAWDMGAYRWSATRRMEFANDWRRNLAITAAKVNRDKSDATLEQWMPPRNQCWYAAQYLQVAVDYGLAVTTRDVATARSACNLPDEE